MNMNKFAIAAAAATVMSFTMANAAFAQQTTQAPMVVAAGEMTTMEKEGSDTWITTKVKANLLTEKGIPSTDIKVETTEGVVALSSDVAVTPAQKTTAVGIARHTKYVKGVTAEALKTQ